LPLVRTSASAIRQVEIAIAPTMTVAARTDQ
jgi:hypothetical protein